MVSTDPIADMLTRIRNAIMVNHPSVEVPYSKLKAQIAKQLTDSGYLNSIKETGEGRQRQLHIVINKPGQAPKITVIKRVSKPGRRAYSKAQDIPTVKSGRGLVIMTTSKGLMTGQDAKSQGLGGEIICEVY